MAARRALDSDEGVRATLSFGDADRRARHFGAERKSTYRAQTAPCFCEVGDVRAPPRRTSQDQDRSRSATARRLACRRTSSPRSSSRCSCIRGRAIDLIIAAAVVRGSGCAAAGRGELNAGLALPRGMAKENAAARRRPRLHRVLPDPALRARDKDSPPIFFAATRAVGLRASAVALAPAHFEPARQVDLIAASCSRSSRRASRASLVAAATTVVEVRRSSSPARPLRAPGTRDGRSGRRSARVVRLAELVGRHRVLRGDAAAAVSRCVIAGASASNRRRGDAPPRGARVVRDALPAASVPLMATQAARRFGVRRHLLDEVAPRWCRRRPPPTSGASRRRRSRRGPMASEASSRACPVSSVQIRDPSLARGAFGLLDEPRARRLPPRETVGRAATSARCRSVRPRPSSARTIADDRADGRQLRRLDQRQRGPGSSFAGFTPTSRVGTPCRPRLHRGPRADNVPDPPRELCARRGRRASRQRARAHASLRVAAAANEAFTRERGRAAGGRRAMLVDQSRGRPAASASRDQRGARARSASALFTVRRRRRAASAGDVAAWLGARRRRDAGVAARAHAQPAARFRTRARGHAAIVVAKRAPRRPGARAARRPRRRAAAIRAAARGGRAAPARATAAARSSAPSSAQLARNRRRFEPGSAGGVRTRTALPPHARVGAPSRRTLSPARSASERSVTSRPAGIGDSTTSCVDVGRTSQRGPLNRAGVMAASDRPRGPLLALAAAPPAPPAPPMRSHALVRRATTVRPRRPSTASAVTPPAARRRPLRRVDHKKRHARHRRGDIGSFRVERVERAPRTSFSSAPRRRRGVRRERGRRRALAGRSNARQRR